MKHLLIFLVLIVSIGCESDDPTTIQDQILGKWNWETSIGGIDGRTDTPQSTNSTIQLEITNGVIIKTVDGVKLYELAYTIERGPSIYNSEERDIMILENDWKQAIEVIGSRLYLREECYDCFQHEYSKN